MLPVDDDIITCWQEQERRQACQGHRHRDASRLLREPLCPPVRDQPDVQGEYRDQRYDVEVEYHAATGQIEGDLEGQGSRYEEAQVAFLVAPSQVDADQH